MGDITIAQIILSIFSGIIVAFSLGLIGGGGSILAVPLLLYLVGFKEAHLVIGTTSLAVAASAFMDFVMHLRQGHVWWRTASIFAVFGSGGAFAGSVLGKALNGSKLLFLFAILMLVVAFVMLRPRSKAVEDVNKKEPRSVGKRPLLLTILIGLGTGALSGFFGIGGGFLIVPGLMMASGMSVLSAVGSSLLSVTAFGLTTTISYATAGLVDWGVAGLFIAGGLIGGYGGEKLSVYLGEKSVKYLRYIYAAVIIAVAIYMIYKNITAF